VAGALLPLLPFALDILAGRMHALAILSLMTAGAAVALMGYGVADRRNGAAWAELEETLNQQAATIDEERRRQEERSRAWSEERRAWWIRHDAERAELDAYVAALVATHAKPRGGRPRGSALWGKRSLAEYLPHLREARSQPAGEFAAWCARHVWPHGKGAHPNTVRDWLTRYAREVEAYTANPDAGLPCTANPAGTVKRGPIE
jgi:hypothetical protein